VRPAASLLEREVGRDPARADVRAANPLLSQLVVEGARQSDLAELRGAVDRFVRKAPSAGFRGERDHVAFAAEHVRQGGSDGVDGAFEVDVQHAVIIGFGHCVNGRGLVDAVVGDYDGGNADQLAGPPDQRRRLRE